MNPSEIEKIIKLSSYWVFSIQKVPASLILYWVKTLQVLFKEDVNRERIMLYALQKQVPTEDHGTDILAAAISILDLIIEKANSEHKIDARDRIHEFRSVLIRKNGIREDQVEKFKTFFKKKLIKNDDRIRIVIPGVIYPLVIDHVLRWILLWAFLPNFSPLFWLLNYLVLPLAILGYSFRKSSKTQKRNQHILDKYGGKEEYQLRVSNSAYQYSIITLISVLGLIVAYILGSKEDSELAITLTALLGYLVYYGIYFTNFSVGKLDEKSLIDQMDDVHRYSEELDADANDQAIIEVQSKLKSNRSRLEAYVLESALFGALSFSGFLQIIAEDLVSFQVLEEFAYHCFRGVESIVFMDIDMMNKSIELLSSKADLFALISVETLLCSILFLAVIASRLRISDMLDNASRHFDLAVAFNVKEENLLFQKESHSEKLVQYNRQIRDHLIVSEKELFEMGPSAAYMRFFRNAGILTFFFILISSSVFISGFLAGFFFIAGLLSVAYFNRQTLREFIEKAMVNLRWLLIRKGNILLAISIFLFVGGYQLRVLGGVRETDWILLSSFILLGFYIFTWIVFVPHFDSKYIGRQLTTEIQGWSTIRFFWGISVMLSAVGFVFALTDLPGAAIILGLGILFTAIVLIFLGRYMITPSWLGIIIGISAAVINWGIGFKILHLPGAAALGSIGTMLFSISFAIAQIKNTRPVVHAILYAVAGGSFMVGMMMKILHFTGAGTVYNIGLFLSISAIVISIVRPEKKRSIHNMLMKTFLFIIIVLVFSVSGPSQTGELAYDHGTLDQTYLKRIDKLPGKAKNIRNRIIDENQKLQSLHSDLDQYIKELNWYRDNVNFYTDVYRDIIIDNYDVAYFLWSNDADSASLQLGYELIKMSNEIAQMKGIDPSIFINPFTYQNKEVKYFPGLEVAYLRKLERPKEAQAAIDRLSSQFKSKIDDNDAFEAELSSLNSQ